MMRVTVEVDADDVLEDIETDDLVDEIIRRCNMRPSSYHHADVLNIIERLRNEGGGVSGMRGEVAEIMRDLMCRRQDAAETRLRNVLATLVPPEMIEASEAMREGRDAAAICLLDRVLQPSPAATATELPIPAQRDRKPGPVAEWATEGPQK